MTKTTKQLSSSLFVTVLTFVIVVVLFALYIYSEKNLEQVQQTKYQAFQLSDELRHSSESLTKMVRSYVVTGNPAFKRYYLDILAIRNGEKSRPIDNEYYWDLAVYGEDVDEPISNTSIPLMTLIKTVQLTDEEYKLLEQAKNNSDQLTVLEKQAMTLFEHQGSQAIDDRKRAKELLFDASYNEAKLSIMRPIGQFRVLLQHRMDAVYMSSSRWTTLFRWGFIVISLFWLVLVWRSYRAMLGFLGAPPNVLHEQIVRFGKDDFSHPVEETKWKAGKDSVMAWLCETRRELQTLTARRKQMEVALLEKTQFLAKSEARMRTIIELSPVPKALVTLDGMVSFINHAFTDCLGYELADIERLEDWWPKAYPDPEYRTWIQSVWQAGLLEQTTDKRVLSPTEIHIHAKDGSVKTVIAEAVMIEDEVSGSFILVVFHDITALRASEAALLETKNRLEAAAEAGIVGIWDWDVPNNHLVWDKVMYQLYGIREEDFAGAYEAWTSAIHPDDRAYVENEIQAALAGERSYAPEFRVVWPDGSIRFLKAMSTAIFDTDHQRVIRLVGVNYDLTEQKKIQHQLDRLAFYDRLTGLPNRRLLEDRLNQSIALAHREGQKVALLFIDLDKFKQVNDEKGHEAGDWLLQNVATRIQHCLRSSDTAARLGGDEFIVLLPNVSAINESVETAERIRQVLEQPFIWEEQQILDISSSIGVAVYPDHADSARDLLRFGDEAMYLAKKGGRNGVSIFGWHPKLPSESETAMLKLNWEAMYECGNAAIDSEHQELFRLANKVLECAFLEDLHTDLLTTVFEEFIAHLRLHFSHEESILASHEYALLDQHVAQHRDLMNKAESLLQQIDRGYDVSPMIQFVVSEVVLSHLNIEDRKFFALFV